ncbi:MAG TPA: baseplate J/gp47 family protein [Patescibacteria group bacterium]|nr:baseplate J/gp47 family protein [Patescibacteria group bacterium]
MNLKDFLASREKPPELYWSLVLEPGWVQSGIWYMEGDTAEVISVSPGAAWETEEELIGAADAALSSSAQKLPEEYAEPSKTVFGVPSAWVKGGDIQAEYLEKIKKICSELSLTPVGFVVLPEAIAHLYKSKEGVPLSALIVGLGKEFLEISVFNMGNLAGTTSVSRSVSLIEDVTEGLARFEGASPLPSRIIVFDGKEGELDEAKQTLTQATWEGEKVKFLHTPKVEIFPIDNKVVATSLAGAAELGNVKLVSAKNETEINEEIENVALPQKTITPEEMGFAVGEDVSQNLPEDSPPPQPPQAAHPVAKTTQKPAAYLGNVNRLFARVKSAAQSLLGKITFKKPKIPSYGKKTLAFGPAFIGVLILLFVLYWWFIPKAVVTIFVSPKNFSQEVEVSFATEGKEDITSGIIPADEIVTEVSGDKTKATTGSKLIGEKAKGTVKISNGNPSPINLSAGTILTSSSGLKFLTNSEASVSGQVLPGSPGTATVDVTAADIGAQYNLPKDEIYSVGNFSKSLVAAVSQGDFSGGSSQQIPAVGKDDQTSLLQELTTELKEKAEGELAGEVSEDQFLITDPAGEDIVSEDFDHKVGDEADNLKLSLTLKVTGIAANREKLFEYAKESLKDKVPTGYVLRETQITYTFEFVDIDDGQYNYKASINANFLPEVNVDAIVSKIAGKTPRVVESYLNSVSGFVHAEVKIRPAFPSFLRTLPHVRKNITVDIVAEQ